MPQVKINIPLKELANIINTMDKKELEILVLMLTDEADDLLERKKDLESGKVKTLSRNDVFNV